MRLIVFMQQRAKVQGVAPERAMMVQRRVHSEMSWSDFSMARRWVNRAWQMRRGRTLAPSCTLRCALSASSAAFSSTMACMSARVASSAACRGAAPQSLLEGRGIAEGTVPPVFYIVTGEPFKQSAELTGEPIKMKA